MAGLSTVIWNTAIFPTIKRPFASRVEVSFKLSISRQTFESIENDLSANKRTRLCSQSCIKFLSKNTLIICNSSPPSCNYDRVELVAFDNFIGVNGQSERFTDMIRDFLIPTCTNLWLNSFSVYMVNNLGVLSARELNFLFPNVRGSTSRFCNILHVFAHILRKKAQI